MRIAFPLVTAAALGAAAALPAAAQSAYSGHGHMMSLPEQLAWADAPSVGRGAKISGTLHFAHGDSFDAAKTVALTPGSVAIMPPGAPMFGYTKQETVIQLHGVGPWGLRYLDPADDPRRN